METDKLALVGNRYSITKLHLRAKLTAFEVANSKIKKIFSVRNVTIVYILFVFLNKATFRVLYRLTTYLTRFGLFETHIKYTRFRSKEQLIFLMI